MFVCKTLTLTYRSIINSNYQIHICSGVKTTIFILTQVLKLYLSV